MAAGLPRSAEWDERGGDAVRAGVGHEPIAHAQQSVGRAQGASQRRPEAVRVLAVNGAAALNAGFIPDDEIPGSRDRPRNRVGGAPPRSRRCARAFECPGPARLAAGTALLWCRHGAVSAPGVQNGGDQPGHHAARHRSPLKTRRKHQAIARFLEDTQASEALIPSVLDTLSPTSPSTDPHRHAGPTDTTAPPGDDT